MAGKEGAAPPKGRRQFRRLGIVGGMVLLVLAAGTAAMFAYDRSRRDVIARGTSVGGIDVGGLSAPAAGAKLRRKLWSRFDRPLTARYRGEHFTITPDELHARPDAASPPMCSGRS
jgi:hypothetical protein